MKGKKSKPYLGSYYAKYIVISNTLALWVLGLFSVCLLHTRQLATALQDNLKMHIYLKKNINSTEQLQLVQWLEKQPFLGLSPITYLTKEEVAQRFIKDTGEDFKDVLDVNPFRDLYIINIANGYQTPSKLSEIKQKIETFPGIFEAAYSELFMKDFSKILSKVQWVLGILGVLLFLVVVTLINKTIRLAIYSQRFIIRTMQLVGATKGFIMRPFLLKAGIMGITAGVFANILLILCLHVISQQGNIIWRLQESTKVFGVLAFIMVFGISFSIFSTYKAISTHLKHSLDHLY